MDNKAIDVGIITIIPTEIKALLSVLNVNGNFEHREYGDANYLKTEIFSQKVNRKLSVVISFLNKDAGNTECAISTTRFLNDWYPKIMCLVGISAGIKGTVKIGDVVIPNKIHDRTIKAYKNGVFNPRTEGYSRSDYINGLMKINPLPSHDFATLCSKEIAFEINSAIKSARNLNMTEEEFDGNISIHDGSILSDNTLIRDSGYFDGIREDLDDKCRGADMEGAGFVRACSVERGDFPWLIIREISDFGNSSKCDDFQFLAAKSACIALRELIVKYFDIDAIKENPRAKVTKTPLEVNIIEQIKEAYKDGRWNEVCRIAPIISRYLWLSGQYELRIEIGNMVVEAASMISDDILRASYLIDDTGWTLYMYGNPKLARTHIKDGLRIAKEKKDFYLSSKAHRHLASIYRRSGKYDAAKSELNFAKVDAEQITDARDKAEMEAALLFSSAKLHYKSSDNTEVSQSLDDAKKAAEKFRAIKDNERAVKVYAFLGEVYNKQGDIANAVTFYSEGLDAAYETGRYDEIKSNTSALINIEGISSDKRNLYIKRVIGFCNIQKLSTEITFWKQVGGSK